MPQASIAAHPAARHQPAAPEPTTRPAHTDGDTTDGDTTDGDTTDGDTTDRSTPDLDVDGNDGIDLTAAARLLPGVLLDRGELCAMVGMTDGELTELETFGVVSPRDSSPTPIYGDDAVEIAKPACEFLRAGVDARHLRNWRTSAEREASLFEQLVTPRFRQRNPEARAEALDQLRRLDGLGAQLRAALTRHALRQHFDT